MKLRFASDWTSRAAALEDVCTSSASITPGTIPLRFSRSEQFPRAKRDTFDERPFSMDVPVEINKLIFNYDQVIIVGPVFPHEVVGFSGGNKYLFPGVAGPQILNFFHWLGAVVTNPMIIGNKWTPVRKVVDRAGAMVSVDNLCFCMVVDGGQLAGLYSWDTGRRMGWRQRTFTSVAHHLQGEAVSHDPVVRAKDVRRVMDRRQMH